MAVLERHRGELRHPTTNQERTAVMLHDSLTGDILYRHLAGISKHESDADLQRIAKTVVEVVLAAIR
jgi:hypothetical protein